MLLKITVTKICSEFLVVIYPVDNHWLIEELLCPDLAGEDAPIKVLNNPTFWRKNQQFTEDDQ